jgi:hypothetical protein
VLAVPVPVRHQLDYKYKLFNFTFAFRLNALGWKTFGRHGQTPLSDNV